MNKILLAAIIAITTFACSPKWAPDHYWAEKRWILSELKGVPVQLSGTNRDAYLEFAWADKRFSGNAGCNRITGTYKLEKKKDIQFSEVTATKMSCPDIAFETTLLNTLNDVDGYEMEGDKMLLKDNKKVVMVFNAK